MAWTTPRTWTTGEVPTAAMFNALRDNLNAIYPIMRVRKSADESVSSASTGSTLQNDDELTFAIAANEIWIARYVLYVTTAATPDFKAAIDVPASATLLMQAAGFSGGSIINTDHLETADATAIAFPNCGTDNYIIIDATVENGANAGNVVLQWAQNTSDAGSTTVKEGSFLVANRVS